MMNETTETGTGPVDAAPEADTSRVSLPRWAVRVTLGLCPLFALMIAALALWMLAGGGVTGFRGLLFGVFWLGATGFCLWSAGLVMLYLRHEPGLSDKARVRLGGAAALVLLSVAVLSMATLLVVG